MEESSDRHMSLLTPLPVAGTAISSGWGDALCFFPGVALELKAARVARGLMWTR